MCRSSGLQFSSGLEVHRLSKKVHPASVRARLRNHLSAVCRVSLGAEGRCKASTADLKEISVSVMVTRWLASSSPFISEYI